MGGVTTAKNIIIIATKITGQLNYEFFIFSSVFIHSFVDTVFVYFFYGFQNSFYCFTPKHKAGILSMNTQLKGFPSFSCVFDIVFMLIVDIWHDLQKGSGSTLSSISCETLYVSRPLVTLPTCVLISDAIIPKEHILGEFRFWLMFLNFKCMFYLHAMWYSHCDLLVSNK